MNRFKIINAFHIILLIGIILTSIGVVYTGFNKKEIVVQKDTVIITAPDYILLKQNDSLYNVIDSLTTLNEKYEEELNIALFKLERIKDYNRIAANGNNIKYLRGWINRVINE